MTPLKNVSASVLQRLKNQAQAEGRVVLDVQLMYAIERFLYRLSASDYCERFVLKGGIALLSLDPHFPRTTRDIDLLGATSNSVEHIVAVVQAICQTPVEDDGIRFDPASVRGEAIREMDVYPGVRVQFVGVLGAARLPMQLDVGFNDRLVVEPPVVALDTRLPDFPAPQVKVYPLEAIIAEKVEAFVQLGLLTGRVKDFYDIWFISETQPVDGSTLCAALRQTFTQRGTTLPASLEDVLDGFPTDMDASGTDLVFQCADRAARQSVPGRRVHHGPVE